MIVLGIDPGIAIVGYGVVHSVNDKLTHISHGVIRTDANLPFEFRLLEIYNDLSLIIEKFKPDCVAIEELFFNTNQKTVAQVFQARGVITLTAVQNKLEYFDYTPLQVKQAIVGYGRAEKKQVMELTRLQLNLSETPKPDDAADALAIALCHARTAVSGLYKYIK